jgi:hypothetical protein
VTWGGTTKIVTMHTTVAWVVPDLYPRNPQTRQFSACSIGRDPILLHPRNKKQSVDSWLPQQ